MARERDPLTHWDERLQGALGNYRLSRSELSRWAHDDLLHRPYPPPDFRGRALEETRHQKGATRDNLLAWFGALASMRSAWHRLAELEQTRCRSTVPSEPSFAERVRRVLHAPQPEATHAIVVRLLNDIDPRSHAGANWIAELAGSGAGGDTVQRPIGADAESDAGASVLDVGGVAIDFLNATKILADELGLPNAGLGVATHILAGRHVDAGWPTKIASRWFVDVFGLLRTSGFAPVRGFSVGGAVVGASSFWRATRALFVSVWRGSRGREIRYCDHEQPFGLRAERAGFLFAARFLDRKFVGRVLGIGARQWPQYHRATLQMVLANMRLDALRVVLWAAPSADARAERFAELSGEVLGQGLPPSLLGLLPKLNPRDGAVFAGRLLSAIDARGFRDEFDDDWDSNPRFMQRIRADWRGNLASEPVFGADELSSGAEHWVRQLSALA